MGGCSFSVRRPCICQLCQKIGRGERIRTSDPHNPIVVRYQTALRPDRTQRADAAAKCTRTDSHGRNDTCQKGFWKGLDLAAQNLQNLFKFHAYLLDNLLTLRDVRLGVFTRQALPCATDREASSYSRLLIWRMISTSWRW